MPLVLLSINPLAVWRVRQLKVMRINHLCKGYHGNGRRLIQSSQRVPGLMFCHLLIKNCHLSFCSYDSFVLFQSMLPKHIPHVNAFIETSGLSAFIFCYQTFPRPLHRADLNKPGFSFPPEQRALYCQEEKAFINQPTSFKIKATTSWDVSISISLLAYSVSGHLFEVPSPFQDL